MKQEIKIEQTLIDDLKVLHGIDAIEEIKNAAKKLGFETEIIITNEGDISESKSITGKSIGE